MEKEICYNPWVKEDREFFSKIGKDFLGFMADYLKEDKISASRYEDIVKKLRELLEYAKSDECWFSNAVAMDVSDAIKEGKVRKEGNILWVGLDNEDGSADVWIRGYEERIKEICQIERLMEYLAAYKCHPNVKFKTNKYF